MLESNDKVQSEGKEETFVETSKKTKKKISKVLLFSLIGGSLLLGGAGGYAGILDGSVLLYKGAQLEDVATKVKAQLGIK